MLTTAEEVRDSGLGTERAAAEAVGFGKPKGPRPKALSPSPRNRSLRITRECTVLNNSVSLEFTAAAKQRCFAHLPSLARSALYVRHPDCKASEPLCSRAGEERQESNGCATTVQGQIAQWVCVTENPGSSLASGLRCLASSLQGLAGMENLRLQAEVAGLSDALALANGCASCLCNDLRQCVSGT